MGSAPASGAVGRALATHELRLDSPPHCSVRSGSLVFAARAPRTAAGAAALPCISTAGKPPRRI